DRKGYARAALRALQDPDLAAVGFDDVLHDGEAEAGAELLGGDEGLEHSLPQGLVDAAACVGHGYLDEASGWGRIDPDPSGIQPSHRIDSIGHEVHQYLLAELGRASW